ncbi:MAG: hypothetical protein E7226_07365 [Clostridiales bacterium]|nr:hypothetical protein [Clostridiales bacterium]
MRLLRGILGFLLALILLASAGLALGSYAVAETVSEDAVEKAITETDAVGKLTDNIIEHNTVNLGGVYGDTMQAILKSNAMTEFFTAYTTRCLQSQIYGEGMEEIGADDLNAAFSKGTDECIENGSISMDRGERALFDEALNTAMPNLTKGINFVLSQMNLTSFVDEDTASQIELARTATSTEVRYGATGIAILACVLLFALYWRSKFGMLLSGIMILVVAAFFFVLSMMIDQTVESSGTGLVLSRQMLYIMVSYGAQQAVRVGTIVGGAMIVGCPIFKLVFRSR